MADDPDLVPVIQNTFAAGEISPALYGRTDLQKFHQSAAIMHNFFVDYKGGASSRPGTQFIGHPGSAGRSRLIPFIFSGQLGQSYMLVFSANKIRFIKNPGTRPYPNSSNAGFILSGGVPYEVVTPYAANDVQFLKFKQVADELFITRHGYPRKKLTRLADTNWTFTDVGPAVALATPVISAITISPNPAGSTDPANTRYMYCVTAVDADGNESNPSLKFTSGAGIDIGTTQGTVSIFWAAVPSAVYYKVYKALPTPGNKLPSPAEQMGFVGYSYGTVFTDSNIVADFARAPPEGGDPFSLGRIIGYTITGSSNDWPSAGTSITVTDATGTGALIYPIIDNNDAGGAGHISGLYIANPGSGYTAPTLTAVGGGTTFTATVQLSPAGTDSPDVVGLFQQRLIYASTDAAPNAVIGSRPGDFTDFRKTNPTIDSDSYTFNIASDQVTNILWLESMPGGLVIGTDSSVVQLTGGSSSAANPVAVTGTNAVVVPQSRYGAADLHPIVIDYDILFVQAEGSIIRDLQYNFFVNIYTGTDITILSSHLFYPAGILDWAYSDVPNKIVWAVRADGVLLSLTWLKAQEIQGWAEHDTQGFVEAVAVVREDVRDALYISVIRNGVRCIERLCDKIYNQIDDSWCLDAALSTPATYPQATLTFAGDFFTDLPVFTGGDVGKMMRSSSARATITAFISSTQVQATVDPNYGDWPTTSDPDSWRLDPFVSSVAGLDHLNGLSVMALADGVVQGPFTVASGTVYLTTPATSVVIGLGYSCQLQQVYLDVGKEVGTIQGERKKIAAASIRVKDTARLQYGITFDTMQEWQDGVSSTDPQEYWPLVKNKPAGLFFGDQRLWLDPDFNVVGSVCVKQDNPLPATVLAIIGEAASGDKG